MSKEQSLFEKLGVTYSEGVDGLLYPNLRAEGTKQYPGTGRDVSDATAGINDSRITKRCMSSNLISSSKVMKIKTMFEVTICDISLRLEVGMEKEDITLLEAETNDLCNVVEAGHIQNLIYVIRGKQVMLDSDLATLYQVETGALNRAVKRNENRFPEDFRFQLTKDEYTNLKCQNGISSENEYGGRRTLPYVFTEQGISMLSIVLKSDVAVNVSIGIMRTFVEMRKYMANTSLLYDRVNTMEERQIIYQNESNKNSTRHLRIFQTMKSRSRKSSLMDRYMMHLVC